MVISGHSLKTQRQSQQNLLRDQMPPKFGAWAVSKMELPLTELGKIMGGSGLGCGYQKLNLDYVNNAKVTYIAILHWHIVDQKYFLYCSIEFPIGSFYFSPFYNLIFCFLLKKWLVVSIFFSFRGKVNWLLELARISVNVNIYVHLN